MVCVVNSLFRNKLKVLMVVISCYFLSVSIIHAADESQDKSNNNEEKVLDEISFTATDRGGEKITINKDYVTKNLGELAKDTDLSKFIL